MRGGCDGQRGLTSLGKVSEGGDRELADAILQGGPCLGGGAFVETSLERGGGGGVGEEEMFGDLLDAPLLRVVDGAELGLRGSEAGE